ncbi:MAG: hypothetical protein MJ059_05550 [Lachnospiraceae bacterium]|nr:hypothetical protein [Lachnospiraceae bacterium]
MGIIIAVIMIPIAMDHLIIGNNIPSNITNESWVSFFGGYLGAIITGIATFVAFYFTFKQSERHNILQQRQSVLPFLDVQIEDAEIDYNVSPYVVKSSTDHWRVMEYTENLVDYCGDKVFPFLETSSSETIHNTAIYPRINSEFLNNKSVGVQIKKMGIKNLGLNSALIVNVFLNEVCQWKFNLGKDEKFEFFFIIRGDMFGKKMDVRITFQDLFGNKYEQKCFAVSYVNPEMNGEYFQRSMTSSPVLKE